MERGGHRARVLGGSGIARLDVDGDDGAGVVSGASKPNDSYAIEKRRANTTAIVGTGPVAQTPAVARDEPTKSTPARAEASRSPLGEVSANDADAEAPALKKTKTSGSGAKTPRTPKDAAPRATRTSRLRAAK